MSELACKDPWRGLYDGIARILLDNRLEPTPTNYALAHRYLTAQDRAFNGSVERAMRTGGLCAASAAAMIAERSVEISAANLQVMAADAQARLTEVAEIVSISREAAADYGHALASNAADLQAGVSPETVVSTLMGLTGSMIGRTRGVEEQLRIACELAERVEIGIVACHSVASARRVCPRRTIVSAGSRGVDIDTRGATVRIPVTNPGCVGI